MAWKGWDKGWGKGDGGWGNNASGWGHGDGWWGNYGCGNDSGWGNGWSLNESWGSPASGAGTRQDPIGAPVTDNGTAGSSNDPQDGKRDLNVQVKKRPAASKDHVKKRPAASKEQVKKRPAASKDQVKKRPAFSRVLQRRAKRRRDGCDLDSEESLFLNDCDHISEEEMEEAEEEIILGTNLMKPGEIDTEPDA